MKDGVDITIKVTLNGETQTFKYGLPRYYIYPDTLPKAIDELIAQAKPEITKAVVWGNQTTQIEGQLNILEGE